MPQVTKTLAFSDGIFKLINNSLLFFTLEITSTSPLFVKAMEEAISDPKNRTALQFWIDFIISSLPSFRSSFDRIVIPVIHSFQSQLWSCCTKMKAFKNASSLSNKDDQQQQSSQLPDFSSERTSLETDFDMMLLAMEKLLIFGLSDASSRISSDELAAKSNNNGGQWFLSDYVSTVLLIDTEGGQGDDSTPLTSSANARDLTLNFLPQLFELLSEIVDIFDLGRSLSATPLIDDSLYYDILESVASPSSSSLKGLLSKETAAFGLKYMGNKIQFRVQRLLDSVYRIYPADVIETIIEVWLKRNYDDDREACGENPSEAIVRVLSLISDCTDRNVLVSVIDSLRSRGAASGNKMKRLVYRSTIM
jgi:hypothetical protein